MAQTNNNQNVDQILYERLGFDPEVLTITKEYLPKELELRQMVSKLKDKSETNINNLTKEINELYNFSNELQELRRLTESKLLEKGLSKSLIVKLIGKTDNKVTKDKSESE